MYTGDHRLAVPEAVSGGVGSSDVGEADGPPTCGSDLNCNCSPTLVSGCTDSCAVSAKRSTASTEARLALAVLTRDRYAA